MKKDRRDKDRVVLKVNYYADYTKDKYERNADENRMAAYLQKELRNWWNKYTNRDKSSFILIVEAGNVVVRPYFPFHIELTQLSMTEEEQENFKTLCAEKTREILEEYLSLEK